MSFKKILHRIFHGNQPSPERLQASQAQAQKIADYKAQNGPYGGKPPAPVYAGPLAGGDNVLSPEHQATNSYDPKYFNKLFEYANATEESPWLVMAKQKQAAEEAQALDQAQQSAAGSLATVRSNLAMRGGLEGGASERLANNQMNKLMDVNQGVRSQGWLNRLGLQTAEQENKISMLGKLPGLEAGRATLENNTNQFNIQNTLAQIKEREQAKLNQYHEDMAAWAAGKQADATARSGGGRKFCFITTVVCEHFGFDDKCYILNMFRKFRDEYMQPDPKMVLDVIEYYKIAPKIVKKLKEDSNDLIYKLILRDFLAPCLRHIEHGENEKAYLKYKDMVNSLKSRYEV